MSGKLNVERAAIAFRGGQWEAQRADRIARLTFQRLQELASRNRAGLGIKREVERLAPRPVRVSPGSSDEEIARAAAAEVYRSLLES